MASGTIYTEQLIAKGTVSIPSTEVSANSYKEISIPITRTGYTPIAVTKVYPNKSGIVLNGFNLQTSYLTIMVRNVTSSEITINSGFVGLLYRKD